MGSLWPEYEGQLYFTLEYRDGPEDEDVTRYIRFLPDSVFDGVSEFGLRLTVDEDGLARGYYDLDGPGGAGWVNSFGTMAAPAALEARSLVFGNWPAVLGASSLSASIEGNWMSDASGAPEPGTAAALALGLAVLAARRARARR